MSFEDLGLIAPLLRTLSEAGYSTPTIIQSKAIPPAIAGNDVLGCAQTGSGKTAAFALPMIQRLLQNPVKQEQVPESKPTQSPSPGHRHRRGNRAPRAFRPLRALVLAPTRELAVQIAQNIHDYAAGTGLRLAAIYGGVSYQPQIRSFQEGIDILVATPGRLIDLLEQGYGDFKSIQMLVLDEADRMLDMGFMPDIRRIIARMPSEKQTMFFSATMPPEIAKLSKELLRNPVRIDIIPKYTDAERIDQTVCFIPKKQKSKLLTGLIEERNITRAIVFTRTKRGANHVAEDLNEAGIKADSIHGNKSQNQRQRTLDAFRTSRLRVLVATDVAARGIDVDGITHVFNYDMPTEPETYTHRIGRTARAGTTGSAISFCDRDEKSKLRAIERLLRHALKVDSDLPIEIPPEPTAPQRQERQGRPELVHSPDQRGNQWKRHPEQGGNRKPKKHKKKHFTKSGH